MNNHNAPTNEPTTDYRMPSVVAQAREELVVTLHQQDWTTAGQPDTLLVIMEQVQKLLRAEGVALVDTSSGEHTAVVELLGGDWPRLQQYCLSATEQPVLSLLSSVEHTAGVALKAGGVTLGTLYAGRSDALSEGDMHVLRAMAAIAANALVMQQQNWREQQHLYDMTLEGWVYALELRDNETKEHTRRVTEMTLELARTVGMSEQQLLHVRRGALLHDIGKIAIPDSILLKPGPLTEEEWHIMRQHPRYAHEMLLPLDFLKHALDIPLYHHEKWDGTGYPYGLKKSQIPLTARIFAIVDVWDALRFDRPYRKAWPEARVYTHIQSLTGTHFDPALVPIFMRLLHEKSHVFSHETSTRYHTPEQQNYQPQCAVA